ncbi:MAG: VWA domain-containing protein [Candidatus Bathyarchaeota archaeon]|nr:VWA domain-containing protein [Candidatus Bathyarchaeota archaeon]
MSRLSVYSYLKVLFAISILLIPFVPQYVQAQAIGTVVTTKTITPNVAVPGEKMTVTINISVTGGPGTGIVDAILVLDRTGSMTGQKFADMKVASKTFIDSFEGDNDRIQLITFSEQANIRKNFTFADNATGKSELKAAIDAIPSPIGLTNLFGAFEKSTQEMIDKGRPEANRAIIFFTDGRPTLGTSKESDFRALAEGVVATGACIHTIGLGNDVNATLLEAMAESGNGLYFFAPTSADLEELFLEISQLLQAPPAENVRVTENLSTDLVIYNDDATQEPNSTSLDEPVRTLYWNISRIDVETSWFVSFTVTAQKRVTFVQSLSPTTVIYDRAGSLDIRIDLPPGFAVREVATTAISQNATMLTEGDVFQVNATVENLGMVNENFPVILKIGRLDSTQDTELEVGRTTVNLASGSSTEVTFNWNTTLWVSPFQDGPSRFGQWNVSVTADPGQTITGDDPTNNTITGDTITLNPQIEGLPAWMIIIFLPFLIIPLVAAVLLGKRRGYSIIPTGRLIRGPPPQPVTTSRMVCPKCYAPLTFMNNYQKWYCQTCRRYV